MSLSRLFTGSPTKIKQKPTSQRKNQKKIRENSCTNFHCTSKIELFKKEWISPSENRTVSCNCYRERIFTPWLFGSIWAKTVVLYFLFFLLFVRVSWTFDFLFSGIFFQYSRKIGLKLSPQDKNYSWQLTLSKRKINPIKIITLKNGILIIIHISKEFTFLSWFQIYKIR